MQTFLSQELLNLWEKKLEKRGHLDLRGVVFSIETSLFSPVEKLSYIRKKKGKYCVFSEKGRNLGCYPTKAGAKKRLRQIEFFKHMKKGEATPILKEAQLLDVKVVYNPANLKAPWSLVTQKDRILWNLKTQKSADFYAGFFTTVTDPTVWLVALGVVVGGILSYFGGKKLWGLGQEYNPLGFLKKHLSTGFEKGIQGIGESASGILTYPIKRQIIGIQDDINSYASGMVSDIKKSLISPEKAPIPQTPQIKPNIEELFGEKVLFAVLKDNAPVTGDLPGRLLSKKSNLTAIVIRGKAILNRLQVGLSGFTTEQRGTHEVLKFESEAALVRKFVFSLEEEIKKIDDALVKKTASVVGQGSIAVTPHLIKDLELRSLVGQEEDLSRQMRELVKLKVLHPDDPEVEQDLSHVEAKLDTITRLILSSG